MGGTGYGNGWVRGWISFRLRSLLQGWESIPRGLKPDFEAESNAEAKASAYPRGKGKDKG